LLFTGFSRPLSPLVRIIALLDLLRMGEDGSLIGAGLTTNHLVGNSIESSTEI